MTSATERIRALLDERGMEWKAPASYDGSTKYDTIVGGYWFHENDGKITVHGLTPEQAIAAMFGRRMLTAEQVRELMEANSRQYQSPTDPYVWLTEYDWQAIADELNAKLRELVRTFYHCTTSGECDECPINDGGPVHLMPDTICDTIHDRMRELGIEVDA